MKLKQTVIFLPIIAQNDVADILQLYKGIRSDVENIIPCDDDGLCISWNTLWHREQIFRNTFHCVTDSKALTAKRTHQAL